MVSLCWDASAWAKRYFAEMGSDAVNELFSSPEVSRMFATTWGYAETHAVLVRRLNSGLLDLPSFNVATSSLTAEALRSRRFDLLSIDDAAIFAAISFIRRHSLNSVDAAILTIFLQFAAAQPAGSPSCVLIASDKRLIRAADAEGMKTLNPETVAAADVPSLISTLAKPSS